MISDFLKVIEAEIKSQSFGSQPKSLYEPIRYIMSLGGKRMRPLLVMLGYSLFKNNPKEIVKYAVAVEAFHNFTIMHDDIMDNAPVRRGRSTVHVQWDTTTGILSGDVMLIQAYILLPRHRNQCCRTSCICSIPRHGRCVRDSRMI